MAFAADTYARKTLIDVAIPGQGIWRNIALIVGFALFISVAAQVSFSPPSWFVDAFASVGIPIDGTPVPVTLQTLAIGLTAASLGSRRAITSLTLYVIAGIVGLPVYAGAVGKVLSGEASFGATSGSLWGATSFLSIPSGGYIVGFIVASFVIGWLAERGWDRSIIRTSAALAVGNAIIYLFGLPWLYVVLSDIPSLGMNLTKTLDFGLWPFIPGDILKLAIATGVLPGVWALLGRRTTKEQRTQ